MKNKQIIIIGGGPAGLIAAQKLAENGCHVTVLEQKPSVARKFLLAGRGGLNITHSEDLAHFVSRYREKSDWAGSWINGFTPDMLRQWAFDLGTETFVGSSGRVFPLDFRAKGILRNWLRRLDSLNVEIKTRHCWKGFCEGGIIIQNDHSETQVMTADAYLFALGGGSYAHMGSDGFWREKFEEENIKILPFRASNVGFLVHWSDFFKEKFHGQPIKNIKLKFMQAESNEKSAKMEEKTGEVMLTRYGIEGGAIYGLSAIIRDRLKHEGQIRLFMDFRPSMSDEQLRQKLGRGRGRKSLTSWLKSKLNLTSPQIALLREFSNAKQLEKIDELVKLIKNCPIILTDIAPIEKAISTAGGLVEHEVNQDLMLLRKSGFFVAGEMLDWEAPTGGYLLQAAFASGVHAAQGIMTYLQNSE